ncbi:MAG: restriction endonuclease subunit S [Bacteroidetes bacterium]|nr:restriction endonuclease subunit S [Bacteroidota bacterium]
MSKVILNEIIQIISGGTPKTSVDEYWNGNIGWLSINDFNNDLRKVYSSEKTITEKGLNESSTKLLEIDDIIISARGTVGVLAQIGKPMAFNQSCFGLRGKKGVVDNTYLYYALKNYVSNIQKKGQGSVFNTINLDSFKLMEIDIETDLSTQQKIASILSALDDKIELNNAINDNLEALTKTIYDYWFVQNADKKWEVKTIDEYAEVTKGDLITAKEAKTGNIKVVAAGVDYSYLHSEYNRLENTITISGSGANAGFINFWREPIFASDCITVRGKTDIETILLLHYLKLVQAHILKQAKGSAQPHVYPSDIKVLSYAVPPQKILNEVEKIFVPLNNQIANNLQQNQQLSALRDWLLPMLMNGQITIR